MKKTKIVTQLQKICNLVKKRSNENNLSLKVLFDNHVYGNCISLLRQELDSMIRIIYLLSIRDLEQRNYLISQTLKGEKWIYKNKNGKNIKITDKDMVELSDKLNGWTKSVYKFGCSFIHLSNFHDYLSEDPVSSLSDNEKQSIIKHMEYYHMVSLDKYFTLSDIIPYLPKIMQKITGNLLCYIEELENDNLKHINEL